MVKLLPLIVPMNFKYPALKRKWWMAGCCLLIMSVNTLKAQYFAIDAGYTGSKMKFEGLNQVIDKYNERRPYLDRELGNINYLDGFTLGMGLGERHLLMDFRLNFANANRYATGDDGNPAYPAGASFRRDLKVRQRTGVLTMGGGKVFRGKTDVGLVLGLRSEVGKTKVFTRVYQDGAEVPEFDEVVDDLFFRAGPTLITLFAPREGVVFQFHLFYVHSLFSWDSEDLDRKLHGSFPPSSENSNHGLGFAFTLGIGNL